MKSGKPDFGVDNLRERMAKPLASPLADRTSNIERVTDYICGGGATSLKSESDTPPFPATEAGRTSESTASEAAQESLRKESIIISVEKNNKTP